MPAVTGAMLPTVKGMKAEGRPFKGVLFAGDDTLRVGAKPP